MGGVISSLFQLVLGVFSKLASDAIDKSLRVSKYFLEEVFKLTPYDQSGAFVAALVLDPSKANGAAEKSDSKWGTIHPCSA